MNSFMTDDLRDLNNKKVLTNLEQKRLVLLERIKSYDENKTSSFNFNKYL